METFNILIGRERMETCYISIGRINNNFGEQDTTDV
jgi:hypothetical protein